MNITKINPSQLIPHPENITIYGPPENVGDLAAQIDKSKWVKPLTVTSDFVIVSGHRRHAAALLLGLPYVPCEVVDMAHEWEVQERLLLENEYREKTEMQRIREFKMWKKVEAAKARTRQSELNGRNELPDNCPEAEEKGEARDAAAKKAGLGSGRRAEDGVKVVDQVDALTKSGSKEKADLLTQAVNQSKSGALAITKFIDELSDEDAAKYAEDLKKKKVTVAQVRKKVQLETNRKKVREQLEKQDLKPEDKKYRIIYADPPWKYGNAMPEYVTEPQDYYTLMDTSDICAMPVKDIAEDNAVLFMWSTSPHLPEALEVVKAWGFKYKTTFIWDKVKHNMGHYNSVRHEILLVCTRGACTPDVKKLFDSVVSIERTAHSKKPEYFREIIETIYTWGNRIELFARSAPGGWDVFGNQSQNK